MSTTTREEWLSSLKAGDQVIVTNYGTSKAIGEVAKRTPSGQIVLKDGDRYNAQGHEIGSAGWSRLSLQKMTPEARTQIEHDTLANNVHSAISRLNNIDRLRSLSNERLEELLAVLRKQEAQG